MHYLYNFNVLQAGNGVGNEFLYIIAAVVGGTLLTGGYGNAFGVAIGAFIFGMTNLCIVYAGLGPELVQGVPRRHAAARGRREPLRQEALDNPEGGLAMSDTLHDHADPELHQGETLVEMVERRQDLRRDPGTQGHQPDRQRRRGDLRAGRQRRRQVHPDQDHLRAAPPQRGRAPRRRQTGALRSPRESLAHGIATVYQDLAVVSLMEVWRNFFLGSEMTKRQLPARPD